jgi:predicted nucleic acid-binding protein
MTTQRIFSGAATRLPGKFRASGEQALIFLEAIEQHLTIVSLESDEYLWVIRRAAANGIVGGTIYDALLAGCAMKAEAETTYTWTSGTFGCSVLRLPCVLRIPELGVQIF